MKKMLAIAGLTLALAACFSNSPEAEAQQASVPENQGATLISEYKAGTLIAPVYVRRAVDREANVVCYTAANGGSVSIDCVPGRELDTGVNFDRL